MPGGWHFLHGEEQLRLDSVDGTLEGTYKKVEKFRIDNQLPVGDVVRDVDSQICGRYPHWCGGVVKSSVEVREAHAPSTTDLLIDSIVAWCGRLLRRQAPFGLVSDEEANRRAELCLQCPRNLRWDGGCPTCVENAERLSAQVRSDRRTTRTMKLGGCTAYRHDNKAAVFVSTDALENVPADSGVPEFCWMTR